jgi:hypothetical protein
LRGGQTWANIPGVTHRPHDFACAALFSSGQPGQSLASDDGRPPVEGSCQAPTSHVRQRATGFGRFYELLKAATRPVVKALYIFPVLLVAKLVLWLMGHPAGDVITVMFVGLVVLCFSLLALLVLLYPLVGPRSGRRKELELRPPGAGALPEVLRRAQLADLPLHGPAELARICDGQAPADGPLRVRGRLQPCVAEHEGPLLRDHWLERQGTVARLLLAHPLALVAEGQPPLLVTFEDAPTVLGPQRDAGGAGGDPDPGFERALRGWLQERAGGRLEPGALLLAPACVLAPGDELELVAAGSEVVQDVSQLALGGHPVRLPGERQGQDQGPYRRDAAGRGLLVTCRPNAPLVLCKR